MHEKGWEAYLRREIHEMENVLESIKDDGASLPQALKQIVGLEMHMRKLRQAWRN